MKALLDGWDRKSKSSIAISIAVHAVVVAGLATITFTYPIVEAFRRPDPTPVQTLRYIRVAPDAVTIAGGTGTRPVARGAAKPTPIPAPSTIPIGIPAPALPTAPSGIAAGGTGEASRSVGIAAGLRPGIPDPRLITNPMAVGRLPETDAQKAERALSAIYDEYLDSVKVALADPRRKPGDWSWGGKDGDKWGWDKDGIHIGGIAIPNVVLAALPLNVGPTGRNMNALTEQRTENYIRSDIKMHGDAMTGDEFRAAVQRIRERVDRERQEKMAKAKPKTPPCCS